MTTVSATTEVQASPVEVGEVPTDLARLVRSET
jgi:hypothetical protein